MKRFFYKAVLYLFPLFFIVVSVSLIDPYYLFHINRAFNQEKYEIGYSFDQGRRYKIFTYLHHPSNNIILGASEINIVNERNIPEKGWHSLSYGGAPLQESLRMFWVATEKNHLKKVLIAPEFIKYYNAVSSGNGDPYYANFNWETSQSAEALRIYQTPLDYFVDKYTLKSTLQCIVGDFGRGKPRGEKSDFWEYQMDYARKIYLGNELIPSKQNEIKKAFEDIGDYCKDHGIEVIVVIPIQHRELMELEYSDKVYPVYRDYIYFLIKTFGQIEYMAYIDSISDDDEFFSDPFHCISPSQYLSELFGDEKKCILNISNVNRIDQIQKKLLGNE